MAAIGIYRNGKYGREVSSEGVCEFVEFASGTHQTNHNAAIHATSISACHNLMQVALIAAPVLILIWSVVVVVVVVACCWCSPLQIVLMLALTVCNLHWWCFAFHQLAQILHLHMW